MSSPVQCQTCGAKLSTQAFGGLCPRCAGRRLLAPAPATQIEESPIDGVGQVVGRYKLLEQVGEGGFGVVYVAEQTEPVRRRVALKVIKLGMDTKQVVARFEAERQALAMMDHPNIAKVFDAGAIEAGRPYFVMELVVGIPITNYCDQNKLPTLERLALFIQVCQAIQHAHQKGIIHRDIKPSNVLVALQDGVPVPKVIDFGIAKATQGRLTDDSVHTQLHQFLGTPAYMSPEQAELTGLDIDTRSDIYSLGVLLYELLAGRTPFESRELLASGLDAMRRTIREQEPLRPSTKLLALKAEELTTTAQRRAVDRSKLLHQIQGDLDWIVMKCLEKDRARRYETANGLAADLQRHLRHEPVTAGPPSTRYRFTKFVRRNRGPMLVAALVTVLLVLGIVGTTWGLIEARRQAGDARNRAAQVEKANEILGSIFDNLDPKTIANAKRPLQAILAEKLNQAVEQLQGEAIGDSLAVANLQNRFGNSLVGLGEPRQAIVLLEKARATRRAKLGSDHPDTLTTMSQLAMAYLDAGRSELTFPLLQETVKLREAKFGPNHPDTLSSMHSLAVAYWHAKQLDKSIPLFEEIRRRLDAKPVWSFSDQVMLSQDLAQNYLDAGQSAKALPMLEMAVHLLKTKNPHDPQTLGAMANLAGAYEQIGKLDLALQLLEETLQIQRTRLGPDHPETLLAMGNLASGYQAVGKLDLSISMSEETLKLRRAKLGPDHPRTLTAMNNLATAYWYAKEFDKSISIFQEAIPRLEAILGPDHPDTLSSRHSLARAYMSAGKLDLARPMLEPTLQRMKAKLGADDSTTLQTMGSLAQLYQNLGKLNLSLSLLDEVLALTRAKLGPDHPSTLSAMLDLGECNQIAGKPEVALPLFEQALKIARAQLASNDPGMLRSMRNLAGAYQAAGKPDRALPLLEESLGLLKATEGADATDTLAVMSTLAPMYWRRKQLDKSIPLLEDLLHRTATKSGRDHPNTVLTVANLGVNYRDAGRLKEALPLLEEAHRAAVRFPQFSWVSSELMMAYQQAGESAKAIPLLLEALAEARGTLPKFSPELAGMLAQTAMALLHEQRYVEAEPILRECLAIRTQELPDNWATFNTQSQLGGALLGQKKYTEAEPLLLKGYRGMKERESKIPPPGRPRLPEALKRLVQYYEAVGRESEAALWRSQLDSQRSKE